MTLLHLDSFGPVRTQSLGGKQYVLVIVDDYSRFTWVILLASKSEAFKSFEFCCKRVQKGKGIFILKIRSDHRGEFKN